MRAVSSPSIHAVHACMNSWTVMAITNVTRTATTAWGSMDPNPGITVLLGAAWASDSLVLRGPTGSGISAGVRIQVAGHAVPVADVRQDRIDLATNLHGVGTTGVEVAASRRVDRARHVTRKDD